MIFNYLREPTPSSLMTSPDAFQYFEYGMFLMGWKPPRKYKILYNIAAIFIAAWSIIYVPTGISISMAKEFKNFKPRELMSVLQLFFNIIGLPFKVLFFKLHIWRFYKAKELMAELDKRCSRLEERMEVHRWVVHSNKAYLIYQMIYNWYAIMTFISAVALGHLPWSIYNPCVDWRQSRQSFWIAAVHETLQMMFVTTQSVMSDIYPLLYGLILRVHIQLLRRRVERLCTDPDKSEAENHEDLVSCIQDHKLIKEYAEMIRPVISRTIFIQFLLVGICLGLSMLQLVFADIWTGLATSFFVAGVMAQSFPFCYVGDLIKSDCEDLDMAIFHSNWLNASRRYKSTLIYFMHSSQNHIAFTAGSIFPISTSSNINVAKLAFSVVTFVNQLDIVDRLGID